jgi:hypothetical protein
VPRSGTPRGRGEDGASLVLALAFLSRFGVLVSTLLSFGFVALETDNVVKTSHARR